jgi:dTDP-4-amino-4,6-dideoxygalactose transaminase
VVTDDPDLAECARRIRQYGWDSDRISRCKGFNSRLDEMQAAVLGVKLGRLEKWNAERRALAESYDRGLRDSGLRLPVSLPDSTPVYYAYAVRHPHRDALRKHLARSGISTAIHYPVPVHLQPAYADLGRTPGSLPATEAAARELLTLPLFPGMRRAELEQVIGAIRDYRLES